MQKILIIIALASILFCCATPNKIKQLHTTKIAATVSLANESQLPTTNKINVIEEQELEVKDLSGNSVIMNAVKDEESGEMVATQQLDAVIVEARFRNIAERNGYVDLAFNINVPKSMQDPEWQVRFMPTLFILEDTLKLDEVHITGADYRAAQLRGYELYNKFLNSIIPDSSDFVKSFTYLDMLESFIKRNFRSLSRLSKDSSFVDVNYAKSLMGVSVQEAIEHYTKTWLVSKNNRKKLNKDKMYNKYIKAPISTAGIRLDSITTSSTGEIKYHYVQTIKTRKNLRKVDMILEGGVYVEGKSIYTMPATAPLTFYISSMTAFAENTERYIKKVVERRATSNTTAFIDFKVGAFNLSDTLHNNKAEIDRIKTNIRELLADVTYDVDSLLITASCSPEGSYLANTALAKNRAEAIKGYFSKFIKNYQDSLKQNLWEIDLTGGDATPSIPYLTLQTKSIPEEWLRLEQLIHSDTNIVDKENLLANFQIADLDVRERTLQNSPDYKYIRSTLYPYLRTVKFDFFLHRKGMIKDTIHTTEIDFEYAEGLQALKDRDYEAAISKLRPYSDFNTAVAFVCMDYNKSALQILENLPRSAKRDYMLAVVSAREGNERKAVEYYLHACEQDPGMKFRGNLDPEISVLIKKYAINKEEDL